MRQQPFICRENTRTQNVREERKRIFRSIRVSSKKKRSCFQRWENNCSISNEKCWSFHWSSSGNTCKWCQVKCVVVVHFDKNSVVIFPLYVIHVRSRSQSFTVFSSSSSSAFVLITATANRFRFSVCLLVAAEENSIWNNRWTMCDGEMWKIRFICNAILIEPK